jgi:hypothetical protein
MSKLKFLDNGARYPRETRRLELGEYDPIYDGDFVEVWVNLSRQMRDRGIGLAREALAIGEIPLGKERDKRQKQLHAELYSFQAEWWGIPVEQAQLLYEEVDAGLYDWMVDRANELRDAYEDSRKKVDDDSTDT